MKKFFPRVVLQMSALDTPGITYPVERFVGSVLRQFLFSNRKKKGRGTEQGEDLPLGLQHHTHRWASNLHN